MQEVEKKSVVVRDKRESMNRRFSSEKKEKIDWWNLPERIIRASLLIVNPLPLVIFYAFSLKPGKAKNFERGFASGGFRINRFCKC